MYFNISSTKTKSWRSSAMRSILFICISFISIVSTSSSLQTDNINLHHSDCFDKYLQQVVRLNRNYEDSLRACYDKDNINRRPPQQLDAEVEIMKHKQTSREACFNLKTCNIITDLFGFFICHSKNAEQNMNKFVIMQLNASSVIIELSDQYDKEEKEILRCQFAAKREYLSDSSTAYKEHLNCLNAIKRKSLKKYNLPTQK